MLVFFIPVHMPPLLFPILLPKCQRPTIRLFRPSFLTTMVWKWSSPYPQHAIAQTIHILGPNFITNPTPQYHPHHHQSL